ncbi:MAG: NUDIX hydrolase [Actinomycetota bacterium]|nr:NUDIX hydrolase [Actinomycetota bacterium]
MGERPVEAAGAVVWRSAGKGLQVLVIHRARYDDWSLPKGKLDTGEHPAVAAVRETLEETGVEVRLGPRLTRHEYQMRPPQLGSKAVTYWAARPLDGAGSAAEEYLPNDEVDAVRWVGLDQAPEVLTYGRDVAVVESFDQLTRTDAHRSSPLTVLRHAAATSRKTWPGDDQDRPLSDEGKAQADRLVPVLAAFGLDTVFSSDAARCVRTIKPYVRAGGLDVDRHERWNEAKARRRDVRTAVGGLVADKRRLVLCTHRPVLPWVFEGLGLPHVTLQPADLFVAHRRRGAVLATELLSP